MKTSFLLSSLCLVAALLNACGEADQRSFTVENSIFSALTVAMPPVVLTGAISDEQRTRIASGLGAICRGDGSGTVALLETGVAAGLGAEIYRLALIAAKADRKGRCDYSDWPEKRALSGERFKQLVSNGDGPSVLLATLLDAQLSSDERRRVLEALAARRYGQAQAAYAALLLREGGESEFPEALRLLDEAKAQGAVPAYALLAKIHWRGQGVAADPVKACDYWREAKNRGMPATAEPGVGPC